MNDKIVLSQKLIESRIFTIRGVQVMLDSDLAEMYDISTGRLNEQVKRNIERFPEDFMFQLNEKEWEYLKSQHTNLSESSFLRSQNAILKDNRGKHRKYLPLVFSEQGVAGLSGVIKSKTATKIHVAIMRAFVAMRKLIHENQLIYSRLDKIELKQLETGHKFEQIFKALENKNIIPDQGIFFDGQIFDAHILVSDIIRMAKKQIVIIDNYVDGSHSQKWKPHRLLLYNR